MLSALVYITAAFVFCAAMVVSLMARRERVLARAICAALESFVCVWATILLLEDATVDHRYGRMNILIGVGMAAVTGRSIGNLGERLMVLERTNKHTTL